MWAIAINPQSGHGKGLVVAAEVIEYFAQRQIQYRTFSGATADELKRDLEGFLISNDCQGVISVGGDGLAHLILQLVVPRNIPLAPMPAGTGNDIVRTLGWSLDDVTSYLDRVTQEAPKPIDLGNVDSEWFAAILSTGFDSIVNERANRITLIRGRMKYNVAIALELPIFKPRIYRFIVDGEPLESEAMLIAVANGSSYGGGMQVCPEASITDGLFDVMILAPVSKIEFLKVFPKVFSGKHITHPAVTIRRCREITIEADAIAYSDGERVGPLPITAKVVPKALLTWHRNP